MNHSHDHNHPASEGWLTLVASGFTLALGLLLGYIAHLSLISNILLLITMLISGANIAKVGVKSLLGGRVNINLLVTIASLGALAIGHVEEGASVLFLFSLAERLEDFAADRARVAIKSLIELKPEVAMVRKKGGEEVVTVEDVWPGEVFVVRPGDRVPLDGVIVEGAANIDQATITGESLPVAKVVGDDVYAGTINLDGFLAVRVTRMSQETMFSKILRLVEEAEEGRSPTEAFVDRFSKFYTPAVICIAIIIAVLPPLLLQQPLHHWVYRSLVMLVVACPCALAISTPVAMVSSIASAGRNGVLVKGGAYLEEVSKARTFAFDKTGTLTQGEFGVTDVISTVDEREVLKKAVSLEWRAEHPIAKAILEKAREEKVESEEASEFKAYVGRGVEACINDKTCCIGNSRLFEELGIPAMNGVVERLESEGKTVVLVSEDNCVIGAIALMDKMREDAGEVLEELRGMKIRVEMLTGDNEVTARSIAEKLRIDDYFANLVPEEKVITLEKIREEYGPVVMVGDGVNDAPALAAAEVGIAMGAIGSDVALETADIALMNDSLRRLPYLVRLSRNTMARIRENIFASIFVKALLVILASLGLVSLWIAVAVGDMGLSLAVILNSLRLGVIKPKPAQSQLAS